MKTLKNFFECYFNQTFGFDDLDKILQDLKNPEEEDYRLRLIIDLHQIIQTKSYAFALHLLKKYADKKLDLEKTEKFIKFLYDRLIDNPTDVKSEDFKRKVKVVFCPVCCPDPEAVTTFNLIDKATIIGKGMKIYICKPCKLVWITENIRADNAQDYKKFMKTLGLKGLWKELSDVDTL